LIQELSPVRRNIMVPRVPRLAYYAPTEILSYRLTGACALIGANHTHTFSVEQNEDVFVYFGGTLASVSDADAKQECRLRVYETTTATLVAARTDYVWNDVQTRGAIGMYNGMPVNKAGSPYTIECHARNVTLTENVDLEWPDFSVWLIRD